MIQPEFLYKLKQLPAETPLTANHVIAILDTVSSLLEKTISIDYDSLPNSKLISEDTLAEWLDESSSTLQKWRVKGGGPSYVRGPKSVRYSVGAVRDWIDSRTVKSTNEAFAKGLSKLEVLNCGTNTSPEIINYPLMLVNNAYVDFFNSFDDELEIERHRIICLRNDSALKPTALDAETREKAEKILSALDIFNKTIIKDPIKAREIYGVWQPKITDSQRLGYFSTTLLFDIDFAKEIGSEFSDEFIKKNFNPTSWLLALLINFKTAIIDSVDLTWSFRYLISRGIDINANYHFEDNIGNVIFDGTIAHLLANSNTAFYQIGNLHESEAILGSLLKELLDLGLNVNQKNKYNDNLSAREMTQLISEQSQKQTPFLSIITKRELYEKLRRSK